MKCPVCKQQSLQLISLSENLPANQCSNCRGIWVSSNQYLAWLRMQPGPLPESETSDFTPELHTNTLKLCPESGHIMKRFKVFPHVDFYLDRCGHCNGIWFDSAEWDALVAHNMQDKVNQFFTAPWQAQLRKKESRANMERIYRSKLGVEDYQRIQEVRAWLDENPRRSMLIAFLQADDPFEV
ncbi:MAG: zf-TFIIB domain-containing protein [Chloroflexota bacterium]